MIKRIAGASAILVALLAGGAAWLWQDMQDSLSRPLSLSQPFTFEVEAGMTIGMVAERLAGRGIIDNPRYLVLEARHTDVARQIKTGQYQIAPGSSARDLLGVIVKGEVVEYSITFIEGWSFAQLRQALALEPRLEQTLVGLSDSEVMGAVNDSALNDSDWHPEGSFFPDTYRFAADSSDLDVLKRARQRMRTILDQEWNQRDGELPYESPYQALIMASIIEKETGLASERHSIAGVFVRRLQSGMRLQSDPTVIYGLGSDFDGNIRRIDLQTGTPYNTYVRHGLPPTPIAMPGEEAINAALHPASGDALYFVAKGDGSHQFSASLSEHNRAVTEYQLRR